MSNIIKTIVIDDNEDAVESILKQFSKSSRVKVLQTFRNGEDALAYLINNADEVDTIIMDVLLPCLDGIGLLEELKERSIKINTIILSSYKDNMIINRSSEYNISYYIQKPFSVYSLEQRVIDSMIYKTNVYLSKDNIDSEVSELLHNVGIPSHISGFKYIREGVKILYNNPRVKLITKDVYPAIAEKFETTSSRVERAIRHAIEVSWIRGDLNLMDDLFGYSISCDKCKPTNSEFMVTIAEKIKLNKNLKM